MSPESMMQKCETCKNLSLWHELTKEVLDENDVKQLHYAQQQKNQNDHLKRVKLSGTMTGIIDLITSKLEFFLYHDFVKNAQTKSFQDRENNLAKNEVLYHFDFSENYQFIPQDEIQSGLIGVISVVNCLLLQFITKMQMIVCSYHVTYAFQSESTVCSSLNVKELLTRNRHEI